TIEAQRRVKILNAEGDYSDSWIHATAPSIRWYDRLWPKTIIRTVAFFSIFCAEIIIQPDFQDVVLRALSISHYAGFGSRRPLQEQSRPSAGGGEIVD